MDFRDLIKLLRRRWKALISIFALAIIASAFFSISATKTYHSQTKVFISTDVSNSTEAFYASAFSTARVQSYADLATSSTVLERVISKLNLDLTPDELASKITATVPTNSVIVTLDVKDTSPRIAQEIAQAEATTLTTYIGEVEAPSGKQTATPVKATVSNRAEFDGTPVSPNIALNIAIAAILGLILGAALALVRDLLDSTVKTHETVEAITKSAVMAHIAYDSEVKDKPLLTDSGTHSARTEGFRLLRTNLQFLELDATPKSFVITSAVPGEGKTSTATNLAIAMAQAGRRVLLLDADLRRPSVARLLNLESSVGLTTVLVGRSELGASIQHHSSGLHLLASGPIPPNPTEILQSQAFRDTLKLLRDKYDAVIVDAPPLLPVADASIIAADCDGAIIVLRYGRTTQDQLRHAVSRVEQVNARVLGALLNMTPKRTKGYGYGYGYGYGPEYAPVARPTGRARRRK